MKRTAFAATAAALALLLAGCVSVETSESRIDVTPGASGTYSSGDTTVVVEPLTAETPAASADSDEVAFLDTVRAKLRPDNVIPDATDEQLIAAGAAACEKIATTENTNTISVIEGEQPNGLGYFTDSGVIVGAARATLCG